MSNNVKCKLEIDLMKWNEGTWEKGKEFVWRKKLDWKQKTGKVCVLGRMYRLTIVLVMWGG